MRISRTKRIPSSVPLKYIVVIILCGLCFFGGVAYQKRQADDPSSKTSAFLQARESNAKEQQPESNQTSSTPSKTHLGQIKSVSADTVVIADASTRKDQSFAITGDTDIRLSGKSVPAVSLKVDYKVVVFTKDGKKADRILAVPPPKKTQQNTVPLSSD